MTLWMIQRPLKVRRPGGSAFAPEAGRDPSEQAVDVADSTRGLESLGASFLQLAR